MGIKWMMCLFVLVSLISSIIGKGNITCYEGTAYRTVENKNDKCSSLPLLQVKCEECYSQGIWQEPTGDEEIPVEFGCKKEGMVDNSESAQPREELTYICETDLCNCSD